MEKNTPAQKQNFYSPIFTGCISVSNLLQSCYYTQSYKVVHFNYYFFQLQIFN